MEHALKSYLEDVARTLAALRACPDKERARLALQRHLAQVTAFQHERFVHLIVTLFFAMLLLLSLAATLFIPDTLYFVLDIIILLTLLFYIKHYYFLENNVQKLYPLTDALFAACQEASDPVAAAPSTRAPS